MNHLSGLDAAFLHLESPETPMHVGGLSILELGPDYTGNFMDDVRNHIQNRMHLAPIFQRKLVNMPFELANPIWVMDDNIDIDYHIRHVIVPPPATRATTSLEPPGGNGTTSVRALLGQSSARPVRGVRARPSSVPAICVAETMYL